jgi:hypothetical protein
LVLVATEANRGIQTPPELADLLLAQQPTQILPGIAGGHHVAGTEYAQPTGIVASRLKAGRLVTFRFYLFIYGAIT